MESVTQELRERLAAFLAEDTPNYSKLVLFGAGNTYQLYKKSIEREGLRFECFIDNNPRNVRGGGSLMGKMSTACGNMRKNTCLTARRWC